MVAVEVGEQPVTGEERGRLIVRIECNRQQQPLVGGLEDTTQRHREAAFDVAAAALGHQVA